MYTSNVLMQPSRLRIPEVDRTPALGFRALLTEGDTDVLLCFSDTKYACIMAHYAKDYKA